MMSDFESKLNARLTDDEYEDCMLENFGKHGRRAEQYWRVIDQSFDRQEALKLLANGQGEDFTSDYILEERNVGFITNDTSKFLALYKRLGLDFVFDKRTGLFFMDLFSGHEMLRSILYESVHGHKIGLSYEDQADLFLEKGMGFFKSSQSPVIHAGGAYTFPAELKVAFGDMIRRIS